MVKMSCCCAIASDNFAWWSCAAEMKLLVVGGALSRALHLDASGIEKMDDWNDRVDLELTLSDWVF